MKIIRITLKEPGDSSTTVFRKEKQNVSVVVSLETKKAATRNGKEPLCR